MKQKLSYCKFLFILFYSSQNIYFFHIYTTCNFVKRDFTTKYVRQNYRVEKNVAKDNHKVDFEVDFEGHLKVKSQVGFFKWKSLFFNSEKWRDHKILLSNYLILQGQSNFMTN